MNATEKLAHIEELLEERARINAQLLAILEDAPEPEAVEDPQPVPRGKTKPAKAGRKCGDCGQVGHSKRTCPGIGNSPAAASSGQPLGEDDFNDLKYLQKTGELSSKDFAEERGVALAEVNKAIRARNFREYERGEFLQNA